MSYPTVLSGMTQNDKPAQWGWVRYEHTYWQNEAGEKMYIAVLRAEHDPFHYTDLHIRFWAKHVRRTLTEVCRGPKTAAEIVKLLTGEATR